MGKQDEKTDRELRSIRDTVESVWVAIVLAFVLRAFMIEAFVIPTGSMAPRLLGEHWSLTCPACGYEYDYGLSSPAQRDSRFDRSRRGTPTGAVCPNCSLPYPYTVQQQYPRGGDRVLVMKYLYDFVEPRPFDVVVFRNPQDNRENYIKRLIGLPGESIEIVHGDVFVRRGEQEPWRIRRKPHVAQEAMWQVVFDNDYRPDQDMLQREGRKSPRWEATDTAWDMAGEGGRVFAFRGSRAPAEVAFQADAAVFLPHYGYNLPADESTRIDPARDVVSDLKLSFVFTPQAADTTVAAHLSSFERRFKAELRGDGEATLWYDPPDDVEGNWVEWGRTQVAGVAPGRSCQVAFTHADFRVTLWVDGQEALASADEQYSADQAALKKRMEEVGRQWGPAATPSPDGAVGRALMPAKPIPLPQVRIVAQGGPARLEHVRLERDVYYTGSPLPRSSAGAYGDFARELGLTGGSGWGTTDHPITLREFKDNHALDQFFCLGDNSPQSHDGRSWTDASPTLQLWDPQTHEALYQLGTVPRYNLIGKAFFVYWPAGFPVPGLSGLPYIPNVGKIRLIR